MSEKVLGFRKNENKERARNGVWTGSYLVKPNKLVPVVSLEWLEKWCKENNLLLEDDEGKVVDAIYSYLLLSAAKKEALR